MIHKQAKHLAKPHHSQSSLWFSICVTYGLIVGAAIAQSGVGPVSPQRQQDVERLLREESIKTERVQQEAIQREQQVRNEQRRQTQRALEIESSNPRAKRAMEALTGEGYRGEKRAPTERAESIVRAEKRTPTGEKAQFGGGNEKRNGIDLSTASMFEKNGRSQEGSLVQREIEKVQRARTETTSRTPSGNEHGRTPSSSRSEVITRPVKTERPIERPVERVRPRPLKPPQ